MAMDTKNPQKSKISGFFKKFRKISKIEKM
jgi:hypothetical protein